jgi:hypothetical protein
VSDAALRPEDAPPHIYGADGNPQFFQDPAMDRFAAVLLNVASELWVQTERVETLTRILDDSGLSSAGARAAITAADDQAREAALRDFVTRLLAPLREPSS